VAEDTTSRKAVIISVIVGVVFVAILVGVVVWALNRPSTSGPDAAANRAAFDSAMSKASVEASYPPGAPIPLTSVKATGEHTFSATFTAEELTALLSAFSYTAELNGSKASVGRATVRLAGPDSLGLDASVNVDGNTLGATMEGPIAYSFGSVTSAGATSANVEGVSLNAAQKTQLTDAVVGYLNAYLAHAPGLRIGSVRIASDGVVVTGNAPDRLTYP